MAPGHETFDHRSRDGDVILDVLETLDRVDEIDPRECRAERGIEQISGQESCVRREFDELRSPEVHTKYRNIGPSPGEKYFVEAFATAEGDHGRDSDGLPDGIGEMNPPEKTETPVEAEKLPSETILIGVCVARLR
jgi:hypothetical protein